MIDRDKVRVDNQVNKAKQTKCKTTNYQYLWIVYDVYLQSYLGFRFSSSTYLTFRKVNSDGFEEIIYFMLALFWVFKFDIWLMVLVNSKNTKLIDKCIFRVENEAKIFSENIANNRDNTKQKSMTFSPFTWENVHTMFPFH